MYKSQLQKICFITTVPLTLSTFLLETAKYIHDHSDLEITFVCSYDESFERSLPTYINYFPINMSRGINLDGITATYKLIKFFKKQKFDLVQYSTPNASFYASIASRIVNIPVRLYCQWGIAYVGFNGIKRIVFKKIEKIVCKLSTKIEPDSVSNLKFSISEKLYSTKKGSVIWNGSANGVNLDKFNIHNKKQWHLEKLREYEIPDKAFVFGFIGRITKDKGINELFASAKAIIENDPLVYLILVGNPEKSNLVDNELYNWARENPNVIFCGYSTEVERYIALMDCFVLPSYREGFGTVVIEAEAMEVPVIVTNIPGPTDAMIDGETGILIEKKSVSELTKAMLSIRHSMILQKKYGIAGRKLVSKSFNQTRLMEMIFKDRLNLLNNFIES